MITFSKARLVLLSVLVCTLSHIDALATADLPSCELRVTCDTVQQLIRGRAVWRLPKGVEAVFSTKNLEIIAAQLNGERIEITGERVTATGVLTLEYVARFERPAVSSADNPGVVAGGMVRPDGVSLTSGWYPAPRGLARYRLTAVVPQGMTAVSEADRTVKSEVAGGNEFVFEFPHPLEGLSLTAAPYRIIRDRWKDVAVEAYFLPKDAGLARGYVEKVKHYLALYTELIGPYPYRRFAVVENLLPTGYSLPTLTLLGREVVRLPFIVNTSLGHEVLHQWFGCSVFGEDEQGNWSEGLTTYLADYYYEEQAGTGSAYRKRLMLDYRNYVTTDNEIALRDFRMRTDRATRAVGYGKAALVFHMLKGQVGADVFYSALRTLAREFRFRPAGWGDIQAVFERESSQTLSWFFEQWLNRAGLPALNVQAPEITDREGAHTVTFRIAQQGEPYRLNLLVALETDTGVVQKTVTVSDAEQAVTVQADSTPRALVLDGGYDIARRLTSGEVPPTVGGLAGCNTRMLVLPSAAKEDYTGLAVTAAAQGYRVVRDAGLRDEDIAGSALLALGPGNLVLQRLFGSGGGQPDDGQAVTLEVHANPLNTAEAVAVLRGGTAAAKEALFKKLQHYGRYSKLVYAGGRVSEKTEAPSERGMRISLRPKVMGLQPRQALSFAEIIRRIKDVPVIYVGEQHTSYEDHLVQLEVVRALHAAGHDIAIGMEMFQRPYQQPLDEYIAGRSDERTFLKDSEYFGRWEYNYHLYRAIMEYARENDIPVVALNAEAEIVKKVSGHGFDSLTDEQRARVPADMDMSDEAYRRRLQQAFAQHHASGRAFENFYQAQILWDETMAHTIADHLAKHPGRQMVVLAGSGHVAYGSGIPQRARRLTGKPYVILLRDAGQSNVAGIADYLLFAESIPAPRTPKMGVMISSADGVVTIDGFAAHSPAKKAGVEKGDRLLKIDGAAMESVDDVHIELLNRKSGDTVQVELLRQRKILPDHTLTLPVTLW